MISTKAHGFLDYLMGTLLIFLPFILDFPDGAATTLPMVFGSGTILYSLITEYELSIAKIIPIQTHLGIDITAGLFLIAAPWLFRFADKVFWPFVILGIFEVVASLMTSKTLNRSHSRK